jgi:hypothetical protein
VGLVGFAVGVVVGCEVGCDVGNGLGFLEGLETKQKLYYTTTRPNYILTLV